MLRARAAVLALLAACDAANATTHPGTTPTPDPAGPARPVATTDPAEPPGPAPLLDPTSLEGVVMSRPGSPSLPAALEASVTGVDREPGAGAMTTWRLSFDDGAGRPLELRVHAPARLPCPLRVGDRVSARVRTTGGGPNERHALVITTAELGLVLAVNEAPPGWKIRRGERGALDRGDSYNERAYGVRFEHAGATVAVAAGAWTRLTVGGATYYLWGSAAQRRLRPGRSPMPDYVEAWLDSAIVRAR